jgi:hypothetical protein
LKKGPVDPSHGIEAKSGPAIPSTPGV